MILAKDGIIQSATEPVKNRRKYWYNTTTNEMYMLDTAGEYRKMKAIRKITTGEECETDESVDGKVEYKKRINCGTLPNNSSLIIETGLENVTYTRPPEGYAQSKENISNVLPLPYLDPRDSNASISLSLISGYRIAMVTCQDRTVYNAVVTVFYIKD